MTDEESNFSRYIVNTAQSSWNSKKQTSYDPNTRIVCVTDTGSDGTGDDKVCINTPRCQFVSSNNECGFLENSNYKIPCTHYFRNELEPPCSSEEVDGENLLFMCYKQQFNKIINNNIVQGTGYCTWCKGTQFEGDYELPKDRSQDLIDLDKGIIPRIRDPIEWDELTTRCENYNECEPSESEELWNKCIYDISNRTMGVDYNSEEYKSSPEKRKELLRTEGFCPDLTCLIKPNSSVCTSLTEEELNKEVNNATQQKEYMDYCEEQLDYLGSIQWGRVMGPNDETAACQYRYNWYHLCAKGTGNSPNIAENYLCTWCPSLQCKVGKMEDICSEVAEGENSWNGVPYCDTDSKHGQLTNKAKELGAPDQCDCFLPKTKTDAPDMDLELEDKIILGIGIPVALIALFSPLFFKE